VSLEVLAPGPLTTIQDLGRPGLAAQGVGPSGAADRGALRLANRLVGNPEGAAGLEVTMGGLHLRAHAPVVLALTGAPCPTRVRGRAEGTGVALHLDAGDELVLGAPAAGLRTYVGVRGGVAVPEVLGSRSTDLLAGLGPAVPRAGDLLPVGPVPRQPPYLDVAPVAGPAAGEVVLRARPGPRDDWFTGSLLGRAWTATAELDRVGVRLTGPPLRRAVAGELPSEGVVRGALQVPPSGLPTLLLADHPVTGGYPVAAVVLDADVDLAAQVRPGQVVRLRAA